MPATLLSSPVLFFPVVSFRQRVPAVLLSSQGIGSGNFATIVGAATISGAFISTTRFGPDLFSTGFDGRANAAAFCGSPDWFQIRLIPLRFSGDGFGVASLISSGSGFSALSSCGVGSDFSGVSTIDGNATEVDRRSVFQ